jgi:lipopolysaccharide transport system permease protein
MYATVVVYLLSSVKGKSYWIIALNPMSYVIEGIKVSTLGVGVLTIETFIYSTVVTFLILGLGVLTFNKVEKTFIDTI